jgi:hypothetical protein
VLESSSMDEARTSRMPSWDCSFRFCLHHQGLSMSSDQRRFFPAHTDLRTGGRQRSTSPCHTRHPLIRGEWSLQHPARPLLPAAKHTQRFGAQWAPWVTKPSSYHHRRRPIASHTTPRAHTARVRTTARLRHLHRSLRSRCLASWPSNAGQAPCTEGSAASDGTQASHHSMRRSPKRISQIVVPVVPRSVEAGKCGPGQSSCPSSRLIVQQPLRRSVRD